MATASTVMAMVRRKVDPTTAAPLEEEAEQILLLAVAASGAVKTHDRDALLHLGDLLAEHLRLRKAAGLASRTDVVASAAKRLRMTAPRVHELVRISSATALLAPEDGIGGLAYSALRFFGTVWDSDTGLLKEGLAARAREVFASAVREDWTMARVQQEVSALTKRRVFERRVSYVNGVPYLCNGKQLNKGDGEEPEEAGIEGPNAARDLSPQEGRAVNVYGKDGRVVGQASPATVGLGRAAHTISAIATVGTSKDVASLLLEAVRQAADPAEVARLVAKGLPEASRAGRKGPKDRPDVHGFDCDD